MLRTIGFASLLALSAPALAEGPRWNYIEAAYQRIDIDDAFVDVDGDGFGIGGAFEIAPSWHILAGYATSDLDFGVDFDQLLIGGGYHTAITPNADFVADIAWTRVEASASAFPAASADDDGFAVRIGLRGMMTDRLELSGFILQTELDDSGGDTGVSGQAWYGLTDDFAVGVELGFSDDVTEYGLGARLYFGN